MNETQADSARVEEGLGLLDTDWNPNKQRRGVACSPDQHRSPPVADQLFPSDWPRSSSNNKLIKTFHFNTIKTNQPIQHHQQHSYSRPIYFEAKNHANKTRVKLYRSL